MIRPTACCSDGGALLRSDGIARPPRLVGGGARFIRPPGMARPCNWGVGMGSRIRLLGGHRMPWPRPRSSPRAFTPPSSWCSGAEPGAQRRHPPAMLRTRGSSSGARGVRDPGPGADHLLARPVSDAVGSPSRLGSTKNLPAAPKRSEAEAFGDHFGARARARARHVRRRRTPFVVREALPAPWAKRAGLRGHDPQSARCGPPAGPAGSGARNARRTYSARRWRVTAAAATQLHGSFYDRAPRQAEGRLSLRVAPRLGRWRGGRRSSGRGPGVVGSARLQAAPIGPRFSDHRLLFSTSTWVSAKFH